MGIGTEPSAIQSFFATPPDYVPKSNGDKVAVWVNNTFLKYREALGYPMDDTAPAFLVSNDLVKKFFGLTALAVKNKVVEVLQEPDYHPTLACLFRAYNEPRTTCCSWWFSVDLDQWKNMEWTKDWIEIQRGLGNDDVVAMLSE